MTVWLDGSAEIALRLERMLFDANCQVHALPVTADDASRAAICRTLNDAGVIALVYGSTDGAIRDDLRAAIGEDHFLSLETPATGESPEAVVDRVYRQLEDDGIIFKTSQGD